MYKVKVSWSGIFCGEERNYKNDKTYLFNHQPTEQEINSKFNDDEDIIRLKNWDIKNVRQEVKDFMSGTYNEESGWKDIKITNYKIIKSK